MTVAFADCAVRISALELRSALRGCELAAGAGASLPPLSVQRFDFPKGTGPRCAAVAMGCIYPSLYDTLQMDASPAEATTLVLLTAGEQCVFDDDLLHVICAVVLNHRHIAVVDVTSMQMRHLLCTAP